MDMDLHRVERIKIQIVIELLGLVPLIVMIKTSRLMWFGALNIKIMLIV